MFQLQLIKELGRGDLMSMMLLAQEENGTTKAYDCGIAKVVDENKELLYKGYTSILDPKPADINKYTAWMLVGEGNYVAFVCKELKD
jgi:hypothetical protein